MRTFGCRVNQAETEELAARLAAAGGEPARSLVEAELCVVNTCTVTRDADREALKFLRRAGRENPRARLVVTGCLAARSPAAVRGAAPGALLASGDSLALALGLGAAAARPASQSRARALLKVQDGCDAACSYCVVPGARPQVSSLPLPEVRARVREAVAAGAAEVVLCGVRLGRYAGADAAGGRVDLPGLLARLLELPGAFRLRLSSLEIGEADERLAAVVAGSGGRICPHLHLPLQSGCDATLRRMRRPYDTAAFARRVKALRRAIPGLAVFADVITGFPGETEAESRESLGFVRSLALSGLHIFPYSSRPGTPAALMPGQVPPETVRGRKGAWGELDRALRGAHVRAAAGQERVAAPLKDGIQALTEDFLTVRLGRLLPGGLWRVRVRVTAGGEAAGVVLGEWPGPCPGSGLAGAPQ